jgi:hypothetical protein
MRYFFLVGTQCKYTVGSLETETDTLNSGDSNSQFLEFFPPYERSYVFLIDFFLPVWKFSIEQFFILDFLLDSFNIFSDFFSPYLN